VIRQSIIHSRSNFKKTPLAETIGSLPMLGGMSVPLQMPDTKIDLYVKSTDPE
jgi:hypothetical protein